MKFSIGQVSKLFEISKDTLRHYDKIGILKPEVNEANGYRYYYEEDLEKLGLILETKYLGISLSEIKETIESESLIQYKNSVEKQEKSIKKQIEELKRKQEHLQEAKEVLDKIINFENKYDFSKLNIYEEYMNLYGIKFKKIFDGSFYKEFLLELEEGLGFDEEEYYYIHQVLEDGTLQENQYDIYIKENKNNKDLIEKYISENNLKVSKNYLSGNVISTYFHGNEEEINEYILSLNKYFNKNKSINVYIMYDFSLPKQSNNDEYFVKIILEVKKQLTIDLLHSLE